MHPTKHKNPLTPFVKHIGVLLLLFLSFPILGQVNLKVGYNIGYVNPTIHNRIYQDYNKLHPWLAQPLKGLHTLNGLQMGLRYRFDKWLGIEINWQNQYHRQTASGIDPIDNRDFSRTVSFRYGSIGLGLENFVGRISWGASFNFDQINYKTNATDIEKYSILKTTGWSSHFFISFDLKGSEILHLSIRPYAQIPWRSFRLDSVYEELNGVDIGENLTEEYRAYGVMLVFYNGY